MTCSIKVEVETSTLCYWTRQFFFFFVQFKNKEQKNHRWTLKHGYQVACDDDSPSSRLKIKKNDNELSWLDGSFTHSAIAPLNTRPCVTQTFWHGHNDITLARKHTHTCTRASSTHKLIPLFLRCFTNKNSVLQVASRPTQICTHSCFFFFLCVNKAGASTSNLDFSFNLFSLILCFNGAQNRLMWQSPSIWLPSIPASEWTTISAWCTFPVTKQ